MLRLSSTSLRIGIAPSGIALLKTSGFFRPQTSVIAECTLTPEQSATPAALAIQLGSLLKVSKCSNTPTTIILADQWVRMFMVTPPQNTSSLDDCQAATAMRFQELYGEAMDSWHISADWQVQHAFLVCAMPENLLAALRQVAAESRLTLLTVVPQFIAAWNQWRKKLTAGAWFGLVQGKSLTLAATELGHVCAVRTSTVPGGALQDANWLQSHLALEALRLDLPPPKLLQLCGPIANQSNAQTEISAHCQRLDAAQLILDRGDISPAHLLARTGSLT